MFPPEFDYRRADSVREAVDLLERHADEDAVVLAGGHGLLPDLKARRVAPGLLVDVGGVEELRGIEVGPDATTVGALATHADVVDADALRERVRVLAAAAEHVGDVQIRNRGTVGGNLAEADPAADLPAAVLAADATVCLRGPEGERSVPAGEFFRGDGETAAGESELVTGLRVPNAPGAGGAYAKKTNPATGYAMVGVAAVVGTDDGEVTAARVAANGVQDRATRLDPVEDALVGAEATDDAVEAAAARAPDGLDDSRGVGDVHASYEFRTRLLETYTARALADAVERATRGAPGA